MKLFYVSTERGWHGGEEQLRLLVEGARSAGHECLVAARGCGKFAPRMRRAGLPIVELPDRVRDPRGAIRLRRAARDFRPDVIHANDPHAVSLTNVACWGLPRVDRGGPVRIASRRVLFPIRSPGKYRRCDRIACVSHAIAELCVAGRLAAELLTVVHDGVDPARMTTGDAAQGRAALGLPNDAPLVLCVAQLSAYKGHRYLLDAWPTVRAAFPAAVLALAGDGPLRSDLESQARALGVADSIRFLGYRTDVPDLVQACDLFVLASPEEGLGTSVLDAMFAERPVVGADAGGIPEMLRDDAGVECGWLVAARDPRALARGLSAALSDAAERRRRAALGRSRAEQEFAAATMIARTLALYESLLGRRG